MPKRSGKDHFLLNFNRNVFKINRTLRFSNGLHSSVARRQLPQRRGWGANGARAKSAAAETEAVKPAAELMLA